jgi:creatinine amidohydrolase/Fe(II)-dependent formamide hydrolase-like protein
MLALAPETVRLEELPPLPEPLKNTDWAIVDYPTFLGQPTEGRTVSEADDPRRATAEAGQEMLAQATKQILEKVREAYSTLEIR